MSKKKKKGMNQQIGDFFRQYNPLLRVFLLCVLVAVLVVIWTVVASPRVEGEPEACFKNERCMRLIGVMDTPRLRAKGLMGHEPLKRDEAMLFVFPKEQTSNFWMKNVSFPIDIVWLDGQRRIVCIEKEVPPCEKDPCPHYPCDKKALFVLELPSGFSDHYLLYENDFVEIKGTEYS